MVHFRADSVGPGVSIDVVPVIPLHLLYEPE